MTNLTTLFVGQTCLHFPSLASTNDYARELLSKNRPAEGTVIWADTQTQGRGQSGSIWQSPQGLNLYCSVILYPQFLAARQHFQLNQVLALAAAATLSELSQAQVQLKWPNDLYCQDRKIGGILIETQIKGPWLQHAVVGMGLNLLQTDFPADLPRAASLKSLGLPSANPQTVLHALCAQLETRYLQLKAGNHAEIHAAYLQHLYGKNQIRQFQEPNQPSFLAQVLDVNPDGQLRLQVQDTLEVRHYTSPKSLIWHFS